MKKFNETAQKLMDTMERMNFDQYIRYVSDRKRIFWTNFIAGLARGFGSVVGIAVLGGLLVLILQRAVDWNLFGGFLAELTQTVLDKLK